MSSIGHSDFKIRLLVGRRVGRRAGFTAVELMVVIAIFTIMTGVVLANLPKFRDQSAVGLVAQQMALVARQAQIYGNNARAFKGENVPAYGLYFNFDGNGSNNNDGINDKSFVVFADKISSGSSGNNILDNIGIPSCGNNDVSAECLEKFTFQGGVHIKPDGVLSCNTSDNPVCRPQNGEVVVIFRNAYPDANFFINSSTQTQLTCLKIVIESIRNPGSDTDKEVVIYSTGHIFSRSPITDSCWATS